MKALLALIILFPLAIGYNEFLCERHPKLKDLVQDEIYYETVDFPMSSKKCYYKIMDLQHATEEQLKIFSEICCGDANNNEGFRGAVRMYRNNNARKMKIKISKDFMTGTNGPYRRFSCWDRTKLFVNIGMNDNLEELDLDAERVKVEIRGNRRLNIPLSFAMKHFAEGNYVQRVGECIFPYFNVELLRMSELDECKIIRGYIRIGAGTVIDKTTAYIEEFRDIFIENSNLENLNFLSLEPDFLKIIEEGKLNVKNNRKLCVSLEDETNLIGKYKVESFENNGDNCDISCNANNIGKTTRCTRMNGDIVVNCGGKPHSDHAAATGYSIAASITGPEVIRKNKLKQLNGALNLNNCPVYMINPFMDSSVIGNIGSVNVVLKNPNGDIMEMNFNEGSPKRMEVHTKQSDYGYMYAADIENRYSFIHFMNAQKPPKGVCVFPRPTDSVKGCEKIEGDLVINRGPSVEVEPTIKEITGCIAMRGVSNVKSFEFLTKIEKMGQKCRWGGHLGAIKQSSCIPYSLRSRINLTELSDMANHPTNYEKCGLEHCVFTSFAKEITNCTLIDGDLVLDENSTTVETAITTVTGCISIVNTRLPNYDFLKTIESFSENCTFTRKTGIELTAIDNNTCVPYSVRASMKSKELRKIIEAGNNKKGCGECPGATVEKLKEGCKVILGDLKVDKLTDKSKGKMEKRLATVEEVYGQLLITDNNASTIEFKNLRIVETNGSGPAIQIVNNSGLVTIETPALTTIVSKNVTKFLIEKNPKWNASETFRKKIKKVTGKECGTDKKSACYFQRVEEPKEEKKDDKKEEDGGLGAGATAAIVVVVLIVVLALVAGGVVAAVLVVRKKKSSKKGEAEGPAGKVPPPAGQKTTEKGAKKSSVTPGKSTGKTSESKGGKKTKTTATGTKSKEALTPMTSNEAITPLGKNSKDRLTRTKSNEAMTPLGKKASKDALTPATGSTEALTPIGSKEAIKKPKVVAPNAKKPAGQPKPVKGKK